MTRIYLLDYKGAGAEIINRSALPFSVGKTKNENLRRQRIASYMLLSYAYGEMFSDSMPPIERDENGRPFFVGKDIDFNLSHDKDISALVISDEWRVGIDVQCLSANVTPRLIDKADNLYAKISPFVLNLDGAFDSLQVKTLALFDENGELRFEEVDSFIVDEVASFDKTLKFFSRWSLIEAVSKAYGEGISGIKKIAENSVSFYVREALITDLSGERYSFAVSKKNK